MSRGKYQDWINEDGLKTLESYARDGLTDKQIAKNVGVAEATFNRWKKKHESIRSVLKKGKRPVDFEVENKLLQRAMGYDYEETETFIEEYNGKKKTKIRKIKKHAPPDTAAMIFWLKNRKPDQWRQLSPEVKAKIEAETHKLEAETAMLQHEVDKLQQNGEVNVLLKSLMKAVESDD